jgi:hypothetical protein
MPETPAVWLTPAQVQWIGTLSPSQRRRFDALLPPAWSYRDLNDVRQSNYRDFPSTLAFLLDVADSGATNDPIIAAEVQRILGPVAIAPPPELLNDYQALLGGGG